jgi:hypothetical protein
MAKPTLIQGVTVYAYRTEAIDRLMDGSYSQPYKSDVISIEIDPVIHDGGLALDKAELKDFIRLLKSTLRQAHLNDITKEHNA